jgi:hypothetical protein
MYRQNISDRYTLSSPLAPPTQRRCGACYLPDGLGGGPVKPVAGRGKSDPLAPVVVPDGWKTKANVLDDAMSTLTILLRCLPDRLVPDVGPKDCGVDERLWHQSPSPRRSDGCILGVNLSTPTRRAVTIRVETDDRVAPAD